VELSVVLVNHNGASCLPRALDALAEKTSEADVECLVVDSGSTDASWKEVNRMWDKARALRFEDNVGFCAGCNRGAEAAAGRLVAFVNFDAVVEPDWDAPLQRLLEDPSISVATGLLLTQDGSALEAAGLEIAPNMATFGRLQGMLREAAPPGPVDVTAASGALMMVRRADFIEQGGFYEGFWMYGEEADYCLTVPGRVVLHPASAIRHAQGTASGPLRSPFRLYWHSRNRLLNAARQLPLPTAIRSVFASAAFDLLVLGQTRNRQALSAVARGWRDGLREMPRERSARTSSERGRAARRLVSLRAAVREQRRLGRV
jgi:N-acetylglucosaminyl-diphospho-decaprenol L-rhamnosyltransferase